MSAGTGVDPSELVESGVYHPDDVLEAIVIHLAEQRRKAG